jgi:hypothetical protein
MRRGLLLILPLLLLACGGEHRQPSLIEEAAVQAEDAGIAPYEKREGLTIDIPYLVGQRFDNLPPEVVADQLGEETGRGEGAYAGTSEIRFPERTLGLYDGEIYQVIVKLEYPMDITTAMGVTGFPLHVPRCIDATLECRLVHHWGMRQISLMRSEKGADTFDEIRVWMYRPQERNLGQ